MTRMIKIFGGGVEANSSKTFQFFPQRKDRKCVGILITSGVEVSLFFDGGNEMIFQLVPVLSNSNIPPNQKVISIKKELKTYIKGKISNSTNKNIQSSIYLLIQ